MSMTSHPAGVLPAMASHGNPPGAASISFEACSLAFARARALRSSMAEVPQVQGAADGGAVRGVAEQRREVREMGDVAHAGRAEGDRDRQRREHGPAVEQWRRALPEQGGTEPGGGPELAGGLAEQDGARVADQTLPVRGDFQGMLPPVMQCMARSAPGWKLCACGNRESPSPRLSSLLNPQGTAASLPSLVIPLIRDRPHP